MTEFFDQLVNVCAPEIAAALKSKDSERAAAVIEGLATMLGRSIARAAGGDAVEIEKILMGCEQHIAVEAAGVADLLNLSATMRARRGL
ncbi:hypothetical protein [Paracoccus sp. (in: a-proteobacteria)]|uniref:hypothetical protein n=1 Tax=Paracoccus sp. TaxID=267 RepID=UPI0028AFEC51|nr:hypothetical protein [Paracoccus sp. (in: a-proteobacteria)]